MRPTRSFATKAQDDKWCVILNEVKNLARQAACGFHADMQHCRPDFLQAAFEFFEALWVIAKLLIFEIWSV